MSALFSKAKVTSFLDSPLLLYNYTDIQHYIAAYGQTFVVFMATKKIGLSASDKHVISILNIRLILFKSRVLHDRFETPNTKNCIFRAALPCLLIPEGNTAGIWSWNKSLPGETA